MNANEWINMREHDKYFVKHIENAAWVLHRWKKIQGQIEIHIENAGKCIVNALPIGWIVDSGDSSQMNDYRVCGSAIFDCFPSNFDVFRRHHTTLM